MITDLFQGYNTFSGTDREPAVKGGSQSLGTLQGATYEVCTDLQQLRRALKIDASVSASYGLFSGSVKSEFIKELDLTTYSLTLVVRAYYGETSEAREVKFIGEPPPAEALADFCAEHGDSYVSQVTLGAEFYAAYVFYSETRSEQESISAELRLKGIGSGGSLDASFGTKFSEARKSVKARTWYSAEVRGLGGVEVPDVDKCIAFGLSFPKLAAEGNSKVCIGYKVRGYEDVLKKPAEFRQVVENRVNFFGTDSKDGWSEMLASLREVRSQITMVKEAYLFYGNYKGDDKLTSQAKTVSADYESLKEFVQKVAGDPTRSYAESDGALLERVRESLKVGTPVLTYEFTNTPKYGREGGDPFEDVTPDIVPLLVRIKSVRLRADKQLDKISTTYATQYPLPEPLGTKSHGRDGGSDQPLLTLDEGDYITNMTGRHGAFVDKLRLIASNGQTTEAGGNGGEPFVWTPGEGQILVGFAGRSGRLVDQIRPLCVKLKPATWKPIKTKALSARVNLAQPVGIN